MATHLILAAFVLAMALLAMSLSLHHKGVVRVARGIDVAALLWLFWLVTLLGDDAGWLLGVPMFLGCFHLGLLMGWAPIRRNG